MAPGAQHVLSVFIQLRCKVEALSLIPAGMDECWLDVTSGNAGYSSPRQIAEEIRAATREELGLTVSIGVSFNKIFAKLGSDLKKPDAITEITREKFKEKIWPLAADEMIYCGPQTMKKACPVRYSYDW